MASFPTSIKVFGPPAHQTDYTDIIWAAHVNEIRDEIIAIESTLGANVEGSFSTVLARILNIEAGGSTGAPVTAPPHTHATLPYTVSVGGDPSASAYITLATDTIQGKAAGGANGPLYINPAAGDVYLGLSSPIAVHVHGSIATTAGASLLGGLTTDTFHATSNAQVDGALTVNGNLSGSTANFPTSLATNYLELGGNSVAVSNSGGFTTSFITGGPFDSTQWKFSGQVQATRTTTGGGDWSSSLFLGITTTDTVVRSLGYWNQYNSAASSFLIDYGGAGSGPGTVGTNYGTYGFQCLAQGGITGSGTFIPVSASSFHTASSVRYKDEVGDHEYGLAHLMLLRAAQWKTKPLPRFEYDLDENGVPIPESERQAGIHEATIHPKLGLVAEDVAEAGIEEAIVRDPDGNPHLIDYNAIVSVLVKSVQELKAEVDDLRAQLASKE